MWTKHLFWECMSTLAVIPSQLHRPAMTLLWDCTHHQAHSFLHYQCCVLFRATSPPGSKTAPLQHPTQPLPPLGLRIRIPLAPYSGLYLTPTTHYIILISLFPVPTPSEWSLQSWSSFRACHPPQWPACQQYHSHIHQGLVCQTLCSVLYIHYLISPSLQP